ncbi:MAG TPA: glucose-6-phosphate isomerase family protein [Nitrososphaeraceae archaeon]|nr:glucose-6-phosphate isomerase family protein [Nitrososphaeraceae archaeon]
MAQALDKGIGDIEALSNFGEQGTEIANNDIYQIIDLELKDMLGEVKQTISRTTLYPNKSTRGHIHEHANESYHFIDGTGLLLLQGEGLNKLYRIQPETWKFIPKKIFHMVINLSQNEDLVFETVYPGKSDRPAINKEDKKKK